MTPPGESQSNEVVRNFWLKRVRTRSGELDDAQRALSEAEDKAEKAGGTEAEIVQAYQEGKR